eukprot:scaffold128331_cov69-Phaeocystis_antarctica.AAC.1
MKVKPIVNSAESNAPAGGRSGAGIELKARRLYGMKRLASSSMTETKPACSAASDGSRPCPVSSGTSSRYAPLAHGAQHLRLEVAQPHGAAVAADEQAEPGHNGRLRRVVVARVRQALPDDVGHTA